LVKWFNHLAECFKLKQCPWTADMRKDANLPTKFADNVDNESWGCGQEMFANTKILWSIQLRVNNHEFVQKITHYNISSYCLCYDPHNMGKCGHFVVINSGNHGHYFCHTRPILVFQLNWSSKKSWLARWATKLRNYLRHVLCNYLTDFLCNYRPTVNLCHIYFPATRLSDLTKIWQLSLSYKTNV
jgi:hypothetical protein